ncbi:hypothetical protein FO488_00030 [Geobacter sp. FeAm09]|uniref:hypothetical protein n=1 Tax=Geobacter sp. FeAm09 TaxID=2597769 RepID=UPI0011EE6875|nr:hypothetical protein [Geobacter sp. FeAm09]QEM66697.1 hypothetical protein FO488_00030 [Geobacter sp. FeAm09]
MERLTITANYSYLETVTDQSMLFSNIIVDPDPLVATTYRSTAHVYGIDAVYAVAEPLDLSFGIQQVRSAARFDVPVRVFTLANVTGSFDTSGITSLTRLDTVETGVTARARLAHQQACGLFDEL